MSQTQIYQKERADYQTQRNQKDGEPNETHIIQKEARQAQCLQWLQTQSCCLNKREVHENQEDINQKTKNGGPIVIINHSDSGQDILSMVEDLLSKNDFSDESSVFVIVPSVDHESGNSSDSQQSTICIQMSLNPLKWKKKIHPLEQGRPKSNRVCRLIRKFHLYLATLHTYPFVDMARQSYELANDLYCRLYERCNADASTITAAAQQGVKISSKGKKFFMEGLPIEVLSFNNKEILYDHRSLVAEENRKKPTRNKLCQITSPDRQVRRTAVQRCHVISTDTTIDRPCCCPVEARETTDYTDYSTNDSYVANVMSGVSGHSFLPRLNVTTPPAPRSTASPCTHPQNPIPQEKSQKQLCQCTPERFMELLQQAVHNARVQNMQSIGCGEGAKQLDAESTEPLPEFTPPVPDENSECSNGLYPPARNPPTCTCLMHQSPGPMIKHFPQKGDGYLIESIEMGKTEQKQPTNKQKRFYSTIGTSTVAKLDRRIKNREKLKNVVCECPEPSPEPNLELCPPSEDIIEACEEDLRRKKMVTERVSVSKLTRKKQPPPEPVLEFNRDQSIRYYVLMKPELFQNIMGEQQAVKTPTVMHACPTEAVARPPPSSAVASALEAAPSGSQDDDDDPFRGLNIKLACQSSASTAFAGIALLCFELPQESFRTW